MNANVGTLHDEPVPASPAAPLVTETRRPWMRAALVIGALELLVLYAPTVAWLWDRWTFSVWHNAHGLIVPFVVGYLVYQELRDFKGPPAQANPWGFALVVPALALHALDAGMHTQLLSAGTIIVLLPGLSLLLLGTARTRAILFPLAFLVFALPIPLSFTEQIHWQLRLIATDATAWLLPRVGIPVYPEGTMLHVPAGALLVGDACSGFSTLYAAAAVAVLTAYSATGAGRRLLVLLGAAPLAIAANILRVSLLVVLVEWQGEWVLDTFLHPLSGMMTFALALPAIFWLGGSARAEAVAR